MDKWNNKVYVVRIVGRPINRRTKWTNTIGVVTFVICALTVLSGCFAVNQPRQREANKNNERQLPFCGDNEQQESKRHASTSSRAKLSPTSKEGPYDYQQDFSTTKGRDNRSKVASTAILVSTIDGRITALNGTDGSVLWSHATKPDSLVASTLDKLKFTNEGKRVHLVPSLDGDLYTFDGERMGAIPLSMDALLSNSMKVAEDTVITGGKEFRTYGIDRNTGRLKYDCGSDGCHQFLKSTKMIDDYEEQENHEDVVVIRRLTKTVRAISARTGLEKWNYSVGVHEVSLATDPLNEGCHHNNRVPRDEVLDIKFLASEGVVIAVDEGNSERVRNWKKELNVSIVHAWQLTNHEMEPLDLFDDDRTIHDSSTESRPILHVGMYKQQLYVVQSQKLRGSLQLEWDTFGTKTYSTVTWKPYLISAHSRTPIIFGSSSPNQLEFSSHHRHEDNGVKTALVTSQTGAEYPFDGGFILYAHDISLESGVLDKSGHKLLVSVNHSKGIDEIETESIPETLDQIIIVSLWYWWKEVLIISVSFAVLTNLCITRHVLHRMKQKFVSESSQEIVVVQPSSPCLIVSEQQPDSLNSSDSQSSALATPPADFISRYNTDFEPIQRLGKGGFGIVVQARNKLDDCDYAIKRISMPNRDNRKARIMREVKALAKLDHVSIVRYYNAWLECPPSDWHDTHFTSIDIDVYTPSSSMTCEELQSLYSKRVQEQQIITSTGDHASTVSTSWSKPNDPFINNNNIDHQSFTIDDVPSKKMNDESDSLNIVFESKSDSGHNKLVSPCDFTSTNTELSSNIMSHESAVKKTDEPPVKPVSLFIFNDKPEKLYLYIQMQLCRKDNLKDWLIYNNENRDKFEVLDFFHQIVSAVDYVHEQGLIHRDLKPSNIFFAQDGSIKVGDFGLAASTSSEALQSPTSSPDKSHQVAPNTRHTDQVGTSLYMSPEQVAEKVYDHKVDIFSLGLIFFELLVPFRTAMERIDVMMKARQLKFPPKFIEYSPDEVQLVTKMLAQQPQDRPSALEIKQHSLLQDFQPRPELLRRHRRHVSRNYSTSSSSESGSGSGLGINFDKDISLM